MKYRFLLLLLFLLTHWCVLGAESVLQLENKLSATKDKIERIDVMIKLARACSEAGDYSKAMHYALEARKQAKQEKYKVGEVKSGLLITSIERDAKKNGFKILPLSGSSGVSANAPAPVETTDPKADLILRQKEIAEQTKALTEQLSKAEQSNASKDEELEKIYGELQLKDLELQQKELQLQAIEDSLNRKQDLLSAKEIELQQKEAAIDVLSREKEVQELKANKAQMRNYFMLAVSAFVLLIVIILIFVLRNNHRKKAALSKALSDLQTTQQQLVQSEKMASLGQLTSGIAHEINNPINFISGSVSSLKRDVLDMKEILQIYSESPNANAENRKKQIDFEYTLAEVDDLLKSIDEGSRRTAEIVKGLRNFSRLDESETKYFSINEGLDSTLAIIHSKFKEQITLVKNYADLPDLEGYPGQLNQVWMNILTNSLQAIEGPGTISITTALDKERVLITISDTGSGMSEETQKRIFEPFFTTKEVGQGTGLGLSISFGIIQKHQGTIEVNSSPGRGTTFIISLPLKQTTTK